MVRFTAKNRFPQGDQIPLKRSFDTAETSDSYSPEVRRGRSVLDVCDAREEDILDEVSSQASLGFSSDTTRRVRHSSKPQKTWLRDYETQYSPNIVLAFDSGGFGPSDAFEDEPRALTFPRPPMQDYSSPANNDMYSNILAMNADLPPRWREENPYDEYSDRQLETVDLGGVEAILVGEIDEVTSKTQLEEPEPTKEEIEAARARARAAITKASASEGQRVDAIMWEAWGCNDSKTRRRSICFVLLLLLIVAMMAFMVGYFRSDSLERATNPITTPPDDCDVVGCPVNLPTPAPTTTPPVGTPTVTMHPTAAGEPTQGATDAPSRWATSSPTMPVLAPTDLPLQVPTPIPTNQPVRAPTQAPAPAPTGFPTVSPTRFPTNAPTSTPTECKSSISVDKACYEERRDIILVQFYNCEPQQDDWVGFWPADEDPENLGDDYLGWAWSCGTRKCDGSPMSLTMGFEAEGFHDHAVRAYLIHDTPRGAPYQSHAMSDPFVVEKECFT